MEVTKKRKLSHAEKLLMGEAVEVRGLEDGFLGSWHPAHIVERESKRCLVEYDHLLFDDQTKALTEYVHISSFINGTSGSSECPSNYLGKIRPIPPVVDLDTCLQYSMCVDAYYQDAWWEGVVFDRQDSPGEWKLYFPDIGDLLIGSIDNLRLTQDWNEATGEWSLRGKWQFLEIIDKLKPEYVVPVSTMQLWYDLRATKKFDQKWTFQGKSVWKDLILEVINSYLKITAVEFLSMLNLTQDLVVPKKRNSLLLTSQIQAEEIGSSLRGCSTKSAGKPSSSRAHHVPTTGMECPNCIAEYLESNQRDHDLAVKVRQHLLFLGWKIENFVSGGTQRTRYHPPYGKTQYSLVKVCELMQGVVLGKSSCDVKEIKEKNASLSPSSDCLNISALKIVPGKSFSDVKEINANALLSPSSDCPNASVLETVKPVESVYCPEAVTEYLQSFGVSPGLDKKRNLASKAKNHLSAIGWKFWLKMRTDGRMEARYTSPANKTYCTLKKACQDVSKETQSDDLPLLTTNCNPPERKKRVIRFHCSTPSSQSETELEDTRFTDGRFNIDKYNLMEKKSARTMPKKRKVTSSLQEKIDSSDVNQSKRVLRSGKRVRQVTPSKLPYNPRNILSLLIDNNILLPRAKVCYRGKDKNILAEGRVTRDGIKCGCCQKVLTLAGFESHARTPYHHPAANIFLEDGRSLVNCQMEFLNNGMKKLLKNTVGRKRKNISLSTNDDICSICHYGGDLVLCDRCPSSFHANCLNLQAVPDGDWFCPSCRCAICDCSEPVDSSVKLNESSTLCCDQCERLFHVSCLRGRGGVNLDGRAKGKWFCCRSCAKIFRGLQKLKMQTSPLGHDNLTWTLIKPMKYQSEDDVNLMAENYIKLSLALEVMHECFEPVKEPRTRRDLVEDVIFGRGSDLKRLNFTGFYTVLLEKNDELVSAATIRIYGDKVAEVPLVGTRFNFRRLGMCRILMNELEKFLKDLGVERLVLPAVPNVLNTWTGSFGFTEMTPSERSEFFPYTFLDFQGTVLCHKLLMEHTVVPLSISRDYHHQEVAEIVDEFDYRNVMPDMCHRAEIEDGDSVEQGLLDIPIDNGSEDPSSDGTATPPKNDQPCTEITEIENNQHCTATENNQQCPATENNSVVTENEDQPVLDRSTSKFKGELKQYSRKKPFNRRLVPGSNYPNVEVSCR